MDQQELSAAVMNTREQYLSNLCQEHGELFTKVTDLFARSYSFVGALGAVLDNSKIEQDRNEMALTLTKEHIEFMLGVCIDSLKLPQEQIQTAAAQARHMLEQIMKVAMLELEAARHEPQAS